MFSIYFCIATIRMGSINPPKNIQFSFNMGMNHIVQQMVGHTPLLNAGIFLQMGVKISHRFLAATASQEAHLSVHLSESEYVCL